MNCNYSLEEPTYVNNDPLVCVIQPHDLVLHASDRVKEFMILLLNNIEEAC